MHDFVDPQRARPPEGTPEVHAGEGNGGLRRYTGGELVEGESLGAAAQGFARIGEVLEKEKARLSAAGRAKRER